MSAVFLSAYKSVSFFIALMDIFLAVQSFRKKNDIGKYLGLACIAAAVVDLSYLVSITAESYLLMSAMSSVYFVAIDIMLLLLITFSVYFTKGSFTQSGKFFLTLACVYAVFEILVFSVNPFWEIAVHFVPRNTVIAKYTYEIKPLYILHLAFSYCLVAVVMSLLIRKTRSTPREYRAQYILVITGILIIIALNSVFLYWPTKTIYSILDYSICAYSLTAFLLYWCCFHYSSHGMLNALKMSIFENLGQGIVLFDYTNRLILYNERAGEMLAIKAEEITLLEDFLQRYDLPCTAANDDGLTVQCYVKANGKENHPLRCDIINLKNAQEHRLGQLFVFSDAELETDLLTGFQNWPSFQLFAKSSPNSFPAPMALAVCDINSLSVINSTLGNQAGNQKIRQLADIIRSVFPKQSYYVRGLDAVLIVLCAHENESGMRKYMERVKNEFPEAMQYAVGATDEQNADILEAVRIACASMRAKKLLDRDSIHSEMLSSLIRALHECDNDAESHVRRTQLMGAKLAGRIELNDSQQSNLSLLCLLHDIGKIGIPLEILNKPGTLTSEEWTILKSHTEKGYEIANSSNELRPIATAIRHHHERWDGGGYPDGLSRESIPLLSRVIAVVDAYDVMTNNRSYRLAMSAEDAMAELRRCAGHQFDPYIVTEFLQLLKEHPPEDTASAPSTPYVAPESSILYGMKAAPVEPGIHVHTIPHSRYTLDSSMRIVDADENFENLTGYSMQDIKTNKIYQSDLIPEAERTEYLCRTTAQLANNPMLFQEHRIQRKDGTIVYVFCLGRIYFDPVVRSERSEIVIADVSSTYTLKMVTEAEHNKAQIRLKHWEDTYRRDSLTGLLNHAAFRNDVEMKILEGNSKVMMLMMDIDNFKQYNDAYGHYNGDRFLVLVAQAMTLALRKDDCACRMGGDEFAAALFFDADMPESVIHSRAQQFFDNVSLTLKASVDSTSVSMGMALSCPGDTFTQLYEASDKALYTAKENGRDRLVIG